MASNANPPTDASSAGTLDGLGFLNGILHEAIGGYVAVQTVQAQRRTADSVTTAVPVRVGSAAAATAPAISAKTLYIAGGVIVAALLALLLFRRK